MKNLILIILISIAVNTFGQTLTQIDKGKIILPVKKELNLKATILKGEIENFILVSEKDLSNPSDFMNSMDEKPDNFDDIFIKFNNSDFGVLLIVVHKLNESITFKARIKIRGRNKFIETSIQPCYPNVISVEQWQDDIELIELYDFEFISE